LKPGTIPPKPTSHIPQGYSRPGQQKKEPTHPDVSVHKLLIVLAVLLCIIVALGLVAVVVMVKTRRSAKNQEPHGDEENGTAQELLQRNNGERRDQNCIEERPQLTNEDEGGAHVPNDEEGSANVPPNDVEGCDRLPNDADERVDVQHNVESPVQESELPPTQPSPSGLIEA
jgi:hypothetical protein